MSKKVAVILAGAGLLGAALVVLPCRAQVIQARDLWGIQRQIGKDAARIQNECSDALAQLVRIELPEQLIDADAVAARTRVLAAQAAQEPDAVAPPAPLLDDDMEGIWMLHDGGGAGWLGVGIEEVTGDKAKELKLPAVRGVVVSEVEPDSPAAKAGLKANDVITEYNGQRIEGTVQFRRLIRETPAGRSAQLTVWRDGRAQSISVELGSLRQKFEKHVKVYGPKEFKFEMPEFNFNIMAPGRPSPRLGISAEDLSGQLGTYFGAPDGQGVLVKEVNPGSPAEKAGMKAGDVITKIEGERVRTMSDLRQKMAAKRESKSVNVTVLRRGAETSLNVEVEQPKPPAPRKRAISHTST